MTDSKIKLIELLNAHKFIFCLVFDQNIDNPKTKCEHLIIFVTGMKYLFFQYLTNFFHFLVFLGPPVEFSPVSAVELHRSTTELDPVVLLCHVSRDDAEVVW